LYNQQRIDQALYERLFFEWGHPKVRIFCRNNHLPYPPLDDEGEILDAPGWYARAREIIAQRKSELAT
jgi:tRNA (guanosine-2'-O-)-methyltransferase